MSVKAKQLSNGKLVIYDEENEEEIWVEGDAVDVEQ